MKESWAKYFIDLANAVAQKSKDPSTKVGAIIISPDYEIISTGYNDLPRGVKDDPGAYPARRERPDKYLWTEHAERNAIYAAAKRGNGVENCTLVLNWWPIPCADCARAVIQSGIKKVIGPRIPFPNQNTWGKPLEIAEQMLKEAGIKIIKYEYEIKNTSLGH